ncbi:conserved hypothetical protein, partial [Ricinus communis]
MATRSSSTKTANAPDRADRPRAVDMSVPALVIGASNQRARRRHPTHFLCGHRRSAASASSVTIPGAFHRAIHLAETPSTATNCHHRGVRGIRAPDARASNSVVPVRVSGTRDLPAKFTVVDRFTKMGSDAYLGLLGMSLQSVWLRADR